MIVSLILILPLLGSIAFLTLAERKIMASVQRRMGPNKVGILGLLQPLADGLKLLLKETIIGSFSNKFLFLIAPIFSFLFSLLGWTLISFSPGIVLFGSYFSLLLYLAISSLAVLGIILAGWSSNSKYALLGSLRTTAQMISYEVSLGSKKGIIILIPIKALVA